MLFASQLQILPTRYKKGTNDDVDFSNDVPAKQLNTDEYNCSHWQNKENTVFSVVTIGSHELMLLPFILIYFIPIF